MTLDCILGCIVRNDAKTTPEYLEKCMSRPDEEEDVRPSALYAMAAALYRVGREPCSTPIIHGTESRSHNAIAHDYQRSSPYRNSSIVKRFAFWRIRHVRNIWTLFPIFGFTSDDEGYLSGTQYIRLIFTEEVQVAVVCHVCRCAHIQPGLEVTTEVHLLDWQYLWLVITEERTMNGSKKAGIVKPTLHVTSFASRYRVLTPVTLLENHGRIALAGWPVYTADILQKNARQLMKRPTWTFIPRSTHFIWSLQKGCRRAQPLTKDSAHQQHKRGIQTNNDKQCCSMSKQAET